MGYFNDIILIDNEPFQVLIYVVANDVITINSVIGKELLSQTEPNIN